MAIVKSLETGYGVTAEYHKIVTTDVNWLNSTIRITIDSFINQQARLDGKMPIIVHSYYFSGDDFTLTTNMNVVGWSYEQIKLKPEWENSLDV